MLKFDFSKKIVLVTGSSRGIGKATLKMFADSGATVIIHYRHHEVAAKQLLEALPAGDHSLFQADLSDSTEVQKLVESCRDKYGRVDVLVNNAGIFEEFDIMAASYGDWQEAWNLTINTNLTAVANLSFLVAKMMKDKGGCRIINISSRGAFRGEPDAPAYGTSKAGVNALGQSLAKALAKYDMFVYTVAPGFVETDMSASVMIGEREKEIKSQSPLMRVARPQEVAQLICYLASEGHDYMTGSLVDINGASYLRT